MHVMRLLAIAAERVVKQSHSIDTRRMRDAELDCHRCTGRFTDGHGPVDAQPIQNGDYALGIITDGRLKTDMIRHAAAGIIDSHCPRPWRDRRHKF
jgi:hypothetical protein